MCADRKENMEEKTGFFEQFYLALVKHRLYKKLISLPKKQHIIYCISITFLLTLISYVVPMTGFLVSLGGYERFFTEKLPAFTVSSGELSIEEPLDFRMNDIHIIVDDSVEAYSQEDLASQDEFVLFFSKTNMVTNLSGIPMGLNYSFFGNDAIDNQYMAGMAPQFYASIVLAGLAAWIGQMISYAFLALLFAVCGLGINKLSGANLSFGKLYCLALYAEAMFALVSQLLVYFFSGIFSYIVYCVAAMFSMRAMNVGILTFVEQPPKQ